MDLDVDADDYALAAVDDTPKASDRTAQSEEEFQAQKASYTAKIEDGDIYKSLPSILPPPSTEGNPKPKLDKKHVQSITAAIGELYYFREYTKMLEVIDWIKRDYDLRPERDTKGKFKESLLRWEARARGKQAEDDRSNAAE